MPYSSSDTLNVFISFASEDEKIAEALARTLRAAFVNAIDVTTMSEFPSGLNWRHLINDSIDRTDVLIAIASGRLKPSHSFTGYEIGSFSMSIRAQPKMPLFESEDRRMIPFAVLARVPDTMNEFEGIDIDPRDLHDVRFDPVNIAGNIDKLFERDGKNAPDLMIHKLLCDIESIFEQASKKKGSIARTEERIKILRDHARSLCKQIFEYMLNREESVTQPKSKLIINLPPGWHHADEYQLLDAANLRVEGPCYDAFGLNDGDRIYKWKEFTSKADDDIAFAWREAFVSLLSSQQQSSFFENNTILSFNRKKIFRIFVSRVARYYSDAADFHVYVVEILRHKDYGDAETTVLLKAMEVSLGYRFMFLEDKSEFSKKMFEATLLKNMQRRVLDMINGLNLLLLTAQEYKLNDPETIIDIMGDMQNGFDEQYEVWQTQKTRLYLYANNLLKMKECTQASKSEFIEVLGGFCSHTRKMNENYTSAVMKLLHSKIEAEEKPPKPPKPPKPRNQSAIASKKKTAVRKKRDS